MESLESIHFNSIHCAVHLHRSEAAFASASARPLPTTVRLWLHLVTRFASTECCASMLNSPPQFPPTTTHTPRCPLFVPAHCCCSQSQRSSPLPPRFAPSYPSAAFPAPLLAPPAAAPPLLCSPPPRADPTGQEKKRGEDGCGAPFLDGWR